MDITLYPRRLSPPKQSFFLLGPRGTGKSTWVKSRFPTALRFDLLDEGLYQSLLADPGLFAGRLRLTRPGAWVWVDEVQRLPALLNEVQRHVEDSRLKFVLSGSSARKLRRAGTNLLAGRALQKAMFPLLPSELGGDFDLETVLKHGSLPVVWSSEDREATLRAYVQTYLKEEIQAEALARNLPGFARFLPIVALCHGQTVNVSSLARDCGVSRTTVGGYLDILEDTLLAFRLPAFESRLRVRERRHPKLHWIDPGLARAARKGLGDVHAEERGSLLEGFVATCLRAHGECDGLFDDLSYWAPAGAVRTEVDFLLRRGKRYLAIEVKSSRRIPDDGLRGLRAIQGLAGLVRRVLVLDSGDPIRTEDGIDVLPLGVFFDSLANGSLWP
ncbi:MAG: ATP-binding protein [Thermoanaerobaculia bacterium]|jgi:predicted AAA+ superfamily ATPase